MNSEADGGYGWIAVASSFVAHFVGFGVIYSFTVFFRSIEEAFGQGRGSTALIASIAAGLMLGVGGVTGRLSDKFGPRILVAAGGVLIGAGLVLSSLASSTLQVYVAYGLVLGIGVSCAFVPSIATVGQWFEKRRGLAIGIAVAGTGIGSLVLAPLSEALIDRYGWRSAMRILALMSVVLVLMAASVLRSRFAMQAKGGAWAAAKGSRTFALLFFSSLVASYGYWVPFFHIVPYAQDRQISKTSAALIVSVMGLSNTAGRIAMGALADRVGRVRMMRISSVALTLALFAWLLAEDLTSLITFGAFYGLFAGAFIALLPAITGDYFGLERLAGMTGLIFSGAAVGTLLGAPITGWLFDIQGAYTVGILIAGGSMLIGTALLMLLPQPPVNQASTT